MTSANAGFAATLLLALSCHGTGSHAPAPTPTQVSPRPSISAADVEVLEFTLGDLATYTGSDSPVVSRGAVAVPLQVAPESADWPVTVDDVLYRYEAKFWKAFPQADETALAEAAADLVFRTTRRAGFSRFRSRDSRVKVAEPNATPQPRYQFLETRPITVWPPGFSTDRRLAVVRMSVPWSIHHANATYVLAKHQGTWTLQVRQFVYYP